MQFNSSVSIKSNNAFICSGLLINGLYFLTPMSYSINAIENTDDEQFPLSKKRKVSRPNLGAVTGAREWEGIKPPKPVASLTKILIPTIMRSPVNMSTYLYNILRYQTSIGRDEISIPHTSSSYTK